MVWEKLIAWLSFAAVLAALAVSGGGESRKTPAAAEPLFAVMGIPCRINARGRPIVTRSVIEGAAAGVNPRGRGKAGGWQSRKAV